MSEQPRLDARLRQSARQPRNSRGRPSPPHLAAIIGTLVVLLAALTVLVVIRPDNALDLAVLEGDGERDDGRLANAAALVRLVGTVVPMTATPVVAIALWRWRTRRAALAFAGTYTAAMVTSIVLKIVVDRPRPNLGEAATIASDAASFPSTSVVSGVVFWGLVWGLAYRAASRAWWRRSLLAASLLLIMLIGPSRIVVGDHWVSDVLAGYVVGGLTLSAKRWIDVRSTQT